MTLSDAVILAMLITFLPFNEGIIAKAPRWRRLAEAIDAKAVAAFNWRANADVAAEMQALFQYFKRASFLCGAALVVAAVLRSPPLIVWTSAALFCCLFACFSFEWTFRHRQAIKPLVPVVAFSLAGPWMLLMLEYLAPNAGVMASMKPLLALLPVQPTTPLQIALTMCLLSLAVLAFYYLFIWLILSPFAYLVLAGLTLSRSVSRFLIHQFNRNVLNDIAVLVHILGPIYLYVAGRPST